MLSLDFPVIESGDRGTLDAWRLTGFEDRNTDRGRVWITTTVAGGVRTVTGYRDEAKTLQVFTGSGVAGARMTLTASGGSGLGGSVYCIEASTPLSTIAVQLLLATYQDIAEAEDELEALRPKGQPPISTNFADIGRRVMRQFITDLARIYPPPRTVSDGLAYPGGMSAQPPGRKGQPDEVAAYIWSRASDRRFEVIGIDPRPYREWAVRYSLHLIWAKRSGGGDDPKLLKAEWWGRKAAEVSVDEMAPYVDVDSDDEPDAPAETTEVRFRRG